MDNYGCAMWNDEGWGRSFLADYVMSEASRHRRYPLIRPLNNFRPEVVNDTVNDRLFAPSGATVHHQSVIFRRVFYPEFIKVIRRIEMVVIVVCAVPSRRGDNCKIHYWTFHTRERLPGCPRLCPPPPPLERHGNCAIRWIIFAEKINSQVAAAIHACRQ